MVAGALKKAFGLPEKKDKNEFKPPPAKTPWNPTQLANRRFFGEDQRPEGVSEVSGNRADSSITPNNRLRDKKHEGKVMSQANKALKMTSNHHYSSMLNSVDENGSQNHVYGNMPINNSISGGQ